MKYIEKLYEIYICKKTFNYEYIRLYNNCQIYHVGICLFSTASVVPLIKYLYNIKYRGI